MMSRFCAMLAQFTRTFADVDLAAPTESSRGRYWYNLHVVLIFDGFAAGIANLQNFVRSSTTH